MKTKWLGDAFEVQLSKAGITLTITADPLKAYQAFQIAGALIEAGQAAAQENTWPSESKVTTASSTTSGAAASSKSPKNGSARPSTRKPSASGTANNPAARTTASVSA